MDEDMNSQIENGNRKTELDAIKIVATMFVVILHTNGYIMPSHGIVNCSLGTLIVYQSLEGVAYIAVHLFVLAGSYIMCQKESINLRSILRIYLITLSVTFTGYLIALLGGMKPSMLSVCQSIFPLTLRAYGYVSSYILLMLLSPFINIITGKLTNKQVFYVTFLLVCVNILFPSLLPFE